MLIRNKCGNMKEKIAIYLIILIMIISSFTVISIAQEESFDNISLEYFFEEPTINKIQINEIKYDKIELKGCECFGLKDEPRLPKKNVNILLPLDTDLKNIEVSFDEKIKIGTNLLILTNDEYFKFTSINYKSEGLSKNNVNYNNELFEKVGVFNCRGYKILVLNLKPVEYNPESGDLFYYPKLNLKIQTIKINSQNLFLRSKPNDELLVKNLVDNPNYISSYRCSKSKNTELKKSENYDYLILTIEDFKDEFQRLANLHSSKGLDTQVKTLSDFGYNINNIKPEDIRNIIRSEYDKGIEYVLLGGDSDILPEREFYVIVRQSGSISYGEMAVDMYFACLDGTFNFDGDDKWGEENDGVGGGEVDLYSEVNLGRACASNLNEVVNFVDKTISYMTIDTNDPYLKKAAFLGEWLFIQFGTDVWGKDYMEELIDGCDHNNYATIGIPSNIFNFGTLYDKEWKENGWIPPGLGIGGWPKSEAINLINEGYHIINHIGHANTERNMKISNRDTSKINNNKLTFFYSQGCDSGNFNVNSILADDCIAEYFTIKSPYGAFAGIWNAGSGWGSIETTDGSSQRFQRQFWDAIFGESSSNPDMKRIGVANQDSRHDLVHMINVPCMRWCYYELTLFGDPAVSLHVDSINNNAPYKPEKPSGPTSGNTTKNFNFSSKTTEPDNDDLYYMFYWDDGTTSDWLGPYKSGEEVTAQHKWDKKGTYKVRVAARDNYNSQSDWSEPLLITIEGKSRFRFLKIHPILSNILNQFLSFF